VRTIDDLRRLLRELRRREARRRDGSERTYRDLAAKAGWSHGLVAAYLTGKILPSTERFDALIRLLGASPVEQGALATARDRGTAPCDAAGSRFPASHSRRFRANSRRMYPPSSAVPANSPISMTCSAPTRPRTSASWPVPPESAKPDTEL
jgi:transcriptional regulator with XRE-family HTH domain